MNRNVVAVILVLERGKEGLNLYDQGSKEPVIIIRFETPEALAFEREGIYFAARSPEIRRHPSVVREPKEGLVPILTGRNLKPGWIYSGLWMPREEAPSLRFFYAFTPRAHA
jgi:adenine-specific DNA-methyltransferase